jgi:hypothetical protein
MILRALVALALLAVAVADVTFGGYSLNNDRLSNDAYITEYSVDDLRLKWIYTANGDISSTPAVVTVNGQLTAFFPDWYVLLLAC